MTAQRPSIRTELPGPKAQAIIETDRKYITPSYTRSYPLVVDHAKGMYITDPDGNLFLDFTAGVAVNTLGHSAPEIVEAVTAQLEKFIHMAGTDFYYSQQSDLAKVLADAAPWDGDAQVFFANSGTEAVEACIKLARHHSGRPRYLAFIGAFHGRSMGSLAFTCSKKTQRARYSPLMSEVTHVHYPDCYHCPYHLEYPSCELHCAKIIESEYLERVCPAEDVAAIVVEPMQGEGGYIVPPDGWFQEIREICDRHGILLIVDEVQAGMGRSGKMFMIEHHGVEPDIVAIAKGIACGFPLGAMMARKELHTWPSGAHASTFGGNPVSCAAALRNLEEIQGGVMKNAAEMGRYMLDKLHGIVERNEICGQARGIGLMLGLEIVKSKESRERHSEAAQQIVQTCFENGLLILTCGKNTIRFLPSLNCTTEHIDIALEIFEEAVKSAATA